MLVLNSFRARNSVNVFKELHIKLFVAHMSDRSPALCLHVAGTSAGSILQSREPCKQLVRCCETMKV